MSKEEQTDALRRAFGSYVTGVVAVTTMAEDVPVGFTANSFTSVSLDPPLLLVCAGKYMSCYKPFASCTHFAINVLAEDQSDIAMRFATHKGDRFEHTAWKSGKTGSPIITGACAAFDCAIDSRHTAGDHEILIGKVLDLHDTGQTGLGYLRHRFFSTSKVL